MRDSAERLVMVLFMLCAASEGRCGPSAETIGGHPSPSCCCSSHMSKRI